MQREHPSTVSIVMMVVIVSVIDVIYCLLLLFVTVVLQRSEFKSN